MRDVVLHETELDGLPVVWRRAPDAGPDPVLWVHGVPDSGALWQPFLERAGGLAPDLPGFGRSGKPAGFGYSIAAYDAWLERFLDHVGVERVALAVHDWGGAALAFAQRRPDRIARIAVIDAVPLLPGHRWHGIARLWRRRVLGELAMGFTSPRTMRLALRRANARPLPDSYIEEALAHFDHGTQRAILRLYRSAPPEALAAAGERLSEIGAPALVVWGEQDPFLGAALAGAYADALGGAAVWRVPGAGHWPWLDDDAVIERVSDFLTAGTPADGEKPFQGASRRSGG
jgi:pimeloyl-ACP methyl ester carboxylesterase